MKSEIHNLNKLTDQIYKEGIEKAEKESKAVLKEAEANREKLLKDATEEAARIVNTAKREAKQLQQRVANELQLKSRQFLSDLQNEIRGLLSDKILEQNTKGALVDVPFLQSMIISVINHWKPEEDLELILPADLEKTINEAFVQSIREVVPNLEVSFHPGLSAGFRIAKKTDTYQISFSEKDFIALFGSYLTTQTQQLLFNDPL